MFCSLADCRSNSLDNPEALIPYTKLGQLLATCAAATGCENFVFSLARKVTWKALGPVGVSMRNASTLGDALSDVVANYNRDADGDLLFLWPGSDAISLCYAVYNVGDERCGPLVVDAKVAAACQVIRSISNVAPLEVLLAHDAPRDTSAYARHFRAPVRFNAEMSGLVFARSAFGAPILGADPAIRKYAKERIDEYWSIYAPNIVSISQRAIFLQILLGGLTITKIAQGLGIQPRTLNRRLKDEGTSFHAEVERLRYELARQLLANTTIPITQISSAFGYSAVSVFSRSFRRWSGAAPREWREQRLS